MQFYFPPKDRAAFRSYMSHLIGLHDTGEIDAATMAEDVAMLLEAAWSRDPDLRDLLQIGSE